MFGYFECNAITFENQFLKQVKFKINNSMRKKNVLYILSNGRVAAIDKGNGNILWEVKLKQYASGSFGYAVGQINLEGDKLYVGVSGVLFCLNAKDGSLIWVNELKGWGYHFVSMANTGIEAQAAAYAQQMANAAAATTTTT